MNTITLNSIVSFIWGIADDILRDVYVRGKYRDVILPMTVLRRLDCLLEPTKDTVLETHQFLNDQHIFHQYPALSKKSGYPFYNASKFTFRRLLDEPSNIRANFEIYLNGFSENVQEIIAKFKLRNQLDTMEDANILYALIEKFLSSRINLSPQPVVNDKGTIIHEGLSNLGMGYVFEELIRKFNEENNEEAGEHFTPRDIIELMSHLIFLPLKDNIESGTYLVYDCACGSGGMLTEAEAFLEEIARNHGKRVLVELYGQEVNPETYAICQSDMLIKGKNPNNIKFGSTLSKDGFSHLKFDFQLANPPYGKSWKIDQDSIFDGKKKEIIDKRFEIGLPRSSDGQLLFLANMLSKMKDETPLGSRIATVHNGSALFTGGAGQGESEIRRWIIENDWLECIIGLPLNMFYNTGIGTYIWILSNRKPTHRKGKIQLIDASEWKTPMRKNLGKKNFLLSDTDIERITDLYIRFEESENSKIFDNEDFGYQQITVERPLRLKFQVLPERIEQFNEMTKLAPAGFSAALLPLFGVSEHFDFNEVLEKLRKYCNKEKIKLKQTDWKTFQFVFTEKDENAVQVKKNQDSEQIEYESDTDLRDYENVPLKENIEEYFRREVSPHVPDAWIDHSKTVRGYEISFTKFFYKYHPLRSLQDITRDIFALERETEGLLHQITAN